MTNHTEKTAYKNTERGFTIVEVLISLTIFSIAVAGVITVAAQGGLNVNAAKNKLTATYLADEGIELVRGLRDTQVSAQPLGSESVGWTAFQTLITPCLSSGSSIVPCDVDSTNASGTATFPDSSNIVSCPLSGCPLYYDTSTGYYHDAWTAGTPPPTPIFSRKIVISSVPLSTDEMTVTATVYWKDGSVQQSLTQTENIFNWY